MLFPMPMKNPFPAYGGVISLLLGSLALSGCRADLSTVTIMVASGRPAVVSAVPAGFRRVAIAHPAQAPHDLLSAYAFLETESRRLTAIRASRLRQAQQEPMSSLAKLEESIGLSDADALLFFQIDAPHLTSSIGAPFSGLLPPVTVTTTIAGIGTEEEFFHDVVSVVVKDPVVYGTEQELAGIYSHLVQFAIQQTVSDLSQAFLTSTDRMTAGMKRDRLMLAKALQNRQERNMVP